MWHFRVLFKLKKKENKKQRECNLLILVLAIILFSCRLSFKVVPTGIVTQLTSLVSSTPLWYRTVQEKLRSVSAEYWHRRFSKELCLTWSGGCALLGSSLRSSEFFISRHLKQVDEVWTPKWWRLMESAVDYALRKWRVCMLVVKHARLRSRNVCNQYLF